MRKLFFTLPILLFVLSACSDPFLNQTYIEKTNADLELTNASFLKKNAADFSMWIELLKYADMYNALNDASTTSTVFAPNNEAMTAFLEWKGVTSVTELSKKYAKYVAQVHILNYDLGESSFITYVEGGSIPIPTIFGTYLSTSYGFLNKNVDDAELVNSKIQDSLRIYLNNQASVTALARTTSNGEVYTLGGVIHPLSETILEVLQTYKEYSIFVEAIEKTGYDKVISQYADTTYNLDGSFSVNDVRFTCFAVPDTIYKQANINTLDDLKSYLNAGTNYTDSTNALNQYVAYHFLGKSYTKAELFTFQEAGQVILFDTKLNSQVVTAEHKNGADLINGVVGITRSGIQARNDLIHKIDNIMPVYEPSPVAVRWDLCNYSDIQSFVNAYGASKNKGDIFSNALTSTEIQIDLSKDLREGNMGSISSFAYKANVAKSPYGTYRKIGFFKCSWAASTTPLVNKYGAYMNNLMIINLGYAGTIEFKTPTIVKGKYKVVFYYGGAAGLKGYYTGGSLTKINLDDYQRSLYMWKGLPAKFTEVSKQLNSNASGVASDVLWDVVQFDRSESHTFKVTLMDINAKTNANYRQMWDYVEFVPITE